MYKDKLEELTEFLDEDIIKLTEIRGKLNERNVKDTALDLLVLTQDQELVNLSTLTKEDEVEC